MNHHQDFPFGRRYKILEDIGHGGMGRVYKVHDSVRNEVLALKELSRQHIVSQASILGFKNEFRIMSEFQHPHMVKVFEFGISAHNHPFITMEFIPGKNLSELSSLSTDQVVEIIINIAQAASCIHSRLYVHRDLKPDNIKLMDDNTIKLLDFGLMSQLGLPASDRVSGTYYYLAPETFTGGIIDESTDVYSIGIIAYELLSGQRPFIGKSVEILNAHLKKTPKPLTDFYPHIPESLNAIVLKMLEKDKDARYRNCPELLEDLEHLTGKPRTIETSEPRQGYLYSSKIIGRAVEQTVFIKKLNLLQNSQTSALFVGAAAGMGKTRLLGEMKNIAELEGIKTIFINSQTAAGQIFGWIKGLMLQLIPLSQEKEVQAYKDCLEYISKTYDSESRQIYENDLIKSLILWIEAVSQKTPFVIFLDDLHWADLKSIQVFNELIRASDRLKVLIIGGFRKNEIEKTSVLWHTVEENLTEYIELKPLDSHQTRTLIENLLYPSPIFLDFSDYCFKNCGGNVFDLIEFLRYMITGGHLTKSGKNWTEPVNLNSLSLPSNMEERLIQRTGRLSPEARGLADIASVIKDRLDLENWQAVSGYDEPGFFQGIDELMNYQIIIKSNQYYQFSHDIIRRVLYENLDNSQKKKLHNKKADFLETRLTPDDRTLIPVIAAHYAAAENSFKAIKYSLEAGRDAEINNVEWDAFDHYRNAARFLEDNQDYPGSQDILLNIYEKAAQFSSAAWIDASTCLKWLQKAIDYRIKSQDMDKVFGLSLSYLVSACISGSYDAARKKIPEIIETCSVKEGTIHWAILYGAGVCLADWYQGYQEDCFSHAETAVKIFEDYLENLPDDVWPAYSWSLFWRDKARAYLGQPVKMENVEKIRQLMEQGKSDQTIYWHTLTAVTARAAFTGHWAELLEWKNRASQLSKQMGKIYWFECWISHSYLYGAIYCGAFSQLENHIKKVQASPDPYQVRLAYLFRGMLELERRNFSHAEQNLSLFLEMEESAPDNSWAEGFVYMAKTCLGADKNQDAASYIQKGSDLVKKEPYKNPLYQLQFLQLSAELAISSADYTPVKSMLDRSLEMADMMDNTIQKAFVHKLFGRYYFEQDEPDKAQKHYLLSRDIFLSLGNKYQAGQVISILECITPKDINTGSHKDYKQDLNLLSKTIIEDQDSRFTLLDNEPEQDLKTGDNMTMEHTVSDAIDKIDI
ncbi:Protein kinase domain-containing protein [Desulfonema limicola]|uniref:Protein kinase domain-containing protein n=1 Tax=Desulfonema limicola TaxID=45656 RepID=A0A975BA17_9BACT|nr:protein kinase [Desulfonema limicola]QTA81784.1 Protein kinase domain-containing protein [Desulfonema limicola]